MLYGLAIALHILSVVIWVGGMFFAYMILRPAAVQLLDPPPRLKLWRGVFERFFPWVWASVTLVPLSGFYMLEVMGGFAAAHHAIKAMTVLGVVMILIFMHVFFAPFKRIKRALDAEDIPAAAKQLNQIRILVGINTLIGVITIVMATAGRLMG